MKQIQGQPLPIGVTVNDNQVNFAVAVPKNRECRLLLYRKGEQKPCDEYEMELSVGEVRALALQEIDPLEYEYNYEVDGEVMVDPYARAIAGREEWQNKRNVQEHEVRGVLVNDTYDWEEDRPLRLPYHQVIAYSLHVRGFTRHSSSQVKHKGTFQGLIEKLPYLCELGINQIHCMPVYEFEECTPNCNYWGYGSAYYFAPKSAYSSTGDGVNGLKDMVKACHRCGIEVVLEMPFSDDISRQMMIECLRYYVMQYHIDGFIVNPVLLSVDELREDPILKGTKLLVHQLGFQTAMRRFLKGDEGMINDVIYWLKHHAEKQDSFNSISGQNGFTLNDLVSYDGKHNEANGENNRDGSDYNFSWNCGAEGPTRKKAVLELRKKQIRNAYFLVLLSQGTPCILAGDEFANTQKGNNNAYCQDNPIGWLDWKKLEKEKELYEFVRDLIHIRKKYPIFAPEKELLGIDRSSCGVPDVSYHGENAWQVQSEVSSRQLGVYYSGAYMDSEDWFVAYNMHWLEHSFANPALPKGKKWYLMASTDEGVLDEPVLLEGQRIIDIKERTIMVMIAR